MGIGSKRKTSLVSKNWGFSFGVAISSMKRVESESRSFLVVGYTDRI